MTKRINPETFFRLAAPISRRHFAGDLGGSDETHGVEFTKREVEVGELRRPETLQGRIPCPDKPTTQLPWLFDAVQPRHNDEMGMNRVEHLEQQV